MTVAMTECAITERHSWSRPLRAVHLSSARNMSTFAQVFTNSPLVHTYIMDPGREY